MNDNGIYDDLVPKLCPSYERALAEFALNAQDASSILELGIGAGNVAKSILERNPCAQYIGIDIDDDLLEKARKKIKRYNHTLHNANFSTMNIPSVDVIVSSLSIHHLEYGQQDDLFTKISTVCGRFIHFELIRGEDQEDQKNIDEYTYAHVRKRCSELNIPFDKVLEVHRNASAIDKPMKISEHERIHAKNGLSIDIVFRDGPFVFYQTSKNPK